MKLYACSHCRQPLYFENSACLHCGHTVGFDAGRLSMSTLVRDNDQEWHDITVPSIHYRLCENAAHGTCNWLVHHEDPSPFCQACALNRTIPMLSSPENLARWKRIEVAKHRLIYSLLRLHLPVKPKNALKETVAPGATGAPGAPLYPGPTGAPVLAGTMPPVSSEKPNGSPQPGEKRTEKPTAGGHEEPDEGIAFDFMADLSPEKRVVTGHFQGTITLNIEEADEAERVRNKLDLGEKYRTLLGHFRHEIGHYYWDLLISEQRPLKKFRQLFGDERKDYAGALKTYYEAGAPADWSEHFISPYASSHPWEDWAETWSHYMHMMDTLETAYSFGIGIRPGGYAVKTDIRRDPYNIAQFEDIIRSWLPLTFAVNSLNRSMGHADFYPFVITPAVIDKLGFIHELCRSQPQPQG